jgi:thermitase
MVAIRPVLLALLMLVVLPASAAANSTTQIIVKRDPGLTAAERADIRADADVRFVQALPLPRTEVVEAAPGDVGDAVRDLNADPDVVYAERDRTVTALAAGPDACGPYGATACLWGHAKIFAGDPDATWARSTGPGRTVAVVDSGVDANHPDLVGRVAAGFDWVDDDADAQDERGHGTHVAGTIAAVRENGTGIVGVAPDARVLPLRVLNAAGKGATSDVIAAFDWAGNQGIRVVNASLGAEGFLQSEYDAIARHPDTLYVVAAGNAGKDNDDPASATYPCAYGIDHPERSAPALDNVLCVGASTKTDDRASFSNFGATSVDLYAPGVGIVSTQLGGLYTSEGTSMATPHVAATAALLAARNPWLSVAELKQAILGNADPVAAGKRLNAAAVLALAPEDPDGDGDLDPADNCPVDYNPDQADLDATGIGDACETGAPMIDRDADGVAESADACPDEKWDTTDGCPVAATTAPDTDHDGVSNARDMCPSTTVAGGFGCLDPDGDRVPNDGRDNCATVWNADQTDTDNDGIGDRCDTTPRGDDGDGDGKGRLDDSCPTVYGTLANGCAPQPAPADSDGDGILGASDACPNETAATINGCRLAEINSLSAKARKSRRKRSATVKIGTTRPAALTITVERKKGRRWVRVARRRIDSSGNRATYKVSRLKRGTHRVRVSISSSAGRGTSVSTTFRVR